MKKNIKKSEFRTYEEILIEDLKNPKKAMGYLNMALMDEDPRVFLLALKDVCKAQGKEMSLIANKSDLNRENLYRMLSKKGNPKLTSIVALLNTVGFSLAVQPYKK
jgi:probable addiction module antidote protein